MHAACAAKTIIAGVSKGKPLDRYGLRVRLEKETPNEIAWIIQAFIIFMVKLVEVELRKLSKEFYKAHPHFFC